MFYIEDNNKIVLLDEDKQKLQDTIAFMPQYEGLEIQEVKEGYIIYNFELMSVEEMEEKQAQKERHRLDMLSMTKREMFLGLYQAKGITPDVLKAQITDPQALIEFEYANDYYRGNVLIDQVGAQLGITSEQLDKFFDSKEYKYLTTCTLTVNVVPEEATVIINDVEQKEITVPYGVSVDVSVECEGYKSVEEVLTLTEDKTLEITLEKIEDDNTDTTTDNANTVHDELQSETN